MVCFLDTNAEFQWCFVPRIESESDRKRSCILRWCQLRFVLFCLCLLQITMLRSQYEERMKGLVPASVRTVGSSLSRWICILFLSKQKEKRKVLFWIFCRLSEQGFLICFVFCFIQRFLWALCEGKGNKGEKKAYVFPFVKLNLKKYAGTQNKHRPGKTYKGRYALAPQLWNAFWSETSGRFLLLHNFRFKLALMWSHPIVTFWGLLFPLFLLYFRNLKTPLGHWSRK